METGKFQPKTDTKKTIAQMSRVQLLNGFEDLHMIDKFSRHFGQHPDEVYENTSFGTVINFLVMWKEQEEYNERFQYFWDEHHKPPQKS